MYILEQYPANKVGHERVVKFLTVQIKVIRASLQLNAGNLN